jgi:hypothetical protein
MTLLKYVCFAHEAPGTTHRTRLVDGLQQKMIGELWSKGDSKRPEESTQTLHLAVIIEPVWLDGYCVCCVFPKVATSYYETAQLSKNASL